MDRHNIKSNIVKNPHLSNLWRIFGTLAVTLVIVLLCAPKTTSAAQSITVKEINYGNSTITLQANSDDNVVYYSNSSQKSWEAIPGELNSDNTITMNISWISVSSNYVITFKGDKSTAVLIVKLPKQIVNFKAAYNKIKGTVAFSNASSRTIQWRKSNSSIWTTVNTDTLASSLYYLYANGSTIYFRLAPINGTKDSVGQRPSKEVACIIPEKTNAPGVTINGSKLSITVNRNMSYRYLYNNGSVSAWTDVTASGELLLSNIAAAALYTNATTIQSEVSMQFRTNATSTSQVSDIMTVIVPIQEKAPDVNEYGISLEYISASSAQLKVKSASVTVPFEYAIIKKDETFSYSDAVWTAITSNSAVVLNSDTVKEGSKVYVRKKSLYTSTSEDFKLASVELNLTGTEGLNYPDETTINSLSKLITTAGVCNVDNTAGNLTFSLYSKYKTTVSTITFRNAYGITKGSVTCKSTVATNSSPSANGSDAYIITTKITSTASIDSITDEVLYADITLANADKIESTKDIGVLLYLHPASKVNNTDMNVDTYTTSFDRVLGSTEASDDTSFSFKIDFGTQFLIDKTDYTIFDKTPTTISSITFDGYTLTAGEADSTTADYTVVYGSYYDEDHEKTIRTATVCVYTDRFENQPSIDAYDIKTAFKINLNTGECLDKDVSLKLIRTATLNEAPIAWSITQGSLLETKTVKTTNADNTVSSETVEVITYTLKLTVFDKKYNVGVSDVTWGDISILHSAVASDGVITVSLSNEKINDLQTQSSTTNNLIFTLSNGYSITSGCKLTILAAN